MSWVEREEWRNKTSWETYWQSLANSTDKNNYRVAELRVDKSYLPTCPLFGYGFARDAFLDNTYEKRSVLFLGNGIDRKPLNYYYSGFDVTVMDISETACELFQEIANKVDNNVRSFLNNIPAIDKNNENSNTEEKPESSQFIYRGGGSIKIVCTDMFDWHPQQKYHYIHNKLAFLGFIESDRRILLDRYFNWLEDSGNLQISYYSSPNNLFRKITNIAKEIGFLVKDEHIHEAFRTSKPFRKDLVKSKEFWLEYDRQELDKKWSVTKGEKMLWVIWGSGL